MATNDNSSVLDVEFDVALSVGWNHVLYYCPRTSQTDGGVLYVNGQNHGSYTNVQVGGSPQNINFNDTTRAFRLGLLDIPLATSYSKSSVFVGISIGEPLTQADATALYNNGTPLCWDSVETDNPSLFNKFDATFDNGTYEGNMIDASDDFSASVGSREWLTRWPTYTSNITTSNNEATFVCDGSEAYPRSMMYPIGDIVGDFKISVDYDLTINGSLTSDDVIQRLLIRIDGASTDIWNYSVDNEHSLRPRINGAFGVVQETSLYQGTFKIERVSGVISLYHNNDLLMSASASGTLERIDLYCQDGRQSPDTIGVYSDLTIVDGNDDPIKVSSALIDHTNGWVLDNINNAPFVDQGLQVEC